MKTKDFEEFIQTKHCEQYQGSKSGCVEDFEDWIADLDVDAWLYYGNLYGVEKSLETISNLKERITKDEIPM